MSFWLLGGLLFVAFVGGFSIGWWTGRKFRLLMPNLWVAFLVNLSGSLGGPLLSYTLFGLSPLSYLSALGIAGIAAGLTFWPMGQRQGSRQWL